MLCFSGKDDDILPALSFLKQFVLMRSSVSAEPPASRVAAFWLQAVFSDIARQTQVMTKMVTSLSEVGL